MGQEDGEELERGGGREVPVEPLQHDHLHVLQLLQAHATVCGDHQLIEAEWSGRSQFRGQAETRWGQQLELGGSEAELREDGVQIDDGAEEDAGGEALTLADLQHPVCDNLAVVGRDGLLDLPHVVTHPELVVKLRHQEVVEDPVTEQDIV